MLTDIVDRVIRGGLLISHADVDSLQQSDFLDELPNNAL
jgi:hypothetical protein